MWHIWEDIGDVKSCLIPEVALGWDFSGIPNPISQIPGFLGFLSQKKSQMKNPGISGIFGIGIFFRVGSQNPKLFPVQDRNSSDFLTRKLLKNPK